MDVILGDENSNLFEQELATTVNGFSSRNDTEASFNSGNSSQEKELRDYNVENVIFRRNIFAESMETFSNEINMRLSQEMNFLMSMMHPQLNRAISLFQRSKIS